jgi:hypothetical protein
MHWLSPAGNPWVSSKNDLLLALDIAAGAGMIYFALTISGFSVPAVFRGLALMSLLAHSYRGWEYFGGANPFCANAPLFAVNNVKLVGLAMIATLILIFAT